MIILLTARRILAIALFCSAWLLATQLAAADEVTVNWNGGTGNWSGSTNWTPAVVPNNGSGTNYAVKISAANSAVTMDVLNATIDSLRIGAASGVLEVSAGSTLNLTLGSSGVGGGATLYNGGTLNGYGDFTTSTQGSIINQTGGNWTNYGSLLLGDGTGAVQNAQGAQFNNAGQLGIKDASFANAGTLINTGTLRVLGPYASLENTGVLQNSGVLIVDFPLNNYGTLTNSGTVTITPSNSLDPPSAHSFNTTTNYVQTGGSTVVDGTLSALNGAIVDIRGGTLGGSGTINGVVVMGGTLSPGNSPGSLTINGSYIQTSNGTFLEQLAGIIPGTEFDQLVVNGGVSLTGGLDLELLNDFAPALGDSFTIMTYDSESGEFGWMDLPTLAEGEAWLVSYNPTDITLSVVTPEPSSLLLLVTSLMLLAAFTRAQMGRNSGRV